MQRRAFLESMAVGAFGASLADLRRAGEFAASAGAQQPYEFLNAEQVRILDAASALIVPTDDTPGAREANVVRFVDHALATFLAERRTAVTNALKSLNDFSTIEKDNKPFADRAADDQLRVLKAFEKKNPGSFNVLRNMTMAGMFSSPEHGGNYNRVGWKLIGYEDRYSWTAPFGAYDR
jgi:gluconate 2-dehydrogenase gamma chain